MNDSEKLKLIESMISDFWEFSDNEQINNCSNAVLTAIYTVVNFDAKESK